MQSTIPVTWSLGAISILDFEKNYSFYQSENWSDYTSSGHDISKICMHRYCEPNPMPLEISDIKQYFMELDNITLAVHKTPPGCYLPMHSDRYARYRQIFNLDPCRSITRAIIMLAHSEPGQIFQIGQETHGHWHAGQVFSWQDQTPHAIYNFSTRDRFAIQITGTTN